MRRLSKILVVATLVFGMASSFTPILAEEVSLISLTQDISLRVSVDQIKDIDDKGSLSKITIEERKAGCLVESSDSNERTLSLSLEGTRFTFSKLPNVILEEGYTGMALPRVEYLDSSRKVIGITMPRNKSIQKKGKMILSGIELQGLSSSTGDVFIKVGSLANEEENSEILVARVADYGLTISPAKNYQLTAGGSKNVTFSIKEIMPGSLKSGKNLELTLDKGHFKADRSGSIDGGSIYLNGVDVTSKVNLDGYDVNGYINSFEIQVPQLDNNKINTLTFKDFEVCTGINELGNVTLCVTGGGSQEETSAVLGEVDKGVDIKIQGVNAALGKKKQKGGSITISEQAGRDLELGYIQLDFEGSPYVEFTKDPEVDVISGDLGVKAVGWSNTTKNRYVLKVTKRSKHPSTIKISDFTYSVSDTAPDGKYGVDIGGSAISPDNEAAERHFDHFMTIGEGKEDDSNGGYMDATYPYPYNNPNYNESNTNSNTIGYTFDDPASNPSYNIYNNPYNNPNNSVGAMTGSSTSNNNVGVMTGSSTSNHNIGNWMGTQMTQFVLNSSTFTVNGVPNEMDAVPFAKEGRTMVPIRYVAIAAGINDEDITYKDGMITIKAGKTIYLYLNSKKMVIDGKVVTMATKPVVMSRRTYVPVAEIAKALDLKVDWDSITQTATFTK